MPRGQPKIAAVKRIRPDPEDDGVKEADSWQIGHDIINSVEVNTAKVKQAVLDSKDAIVPKIGYAQSSIDVLSDNNGLILSNTTEVKKLILDLTSKVDKLETKMAVCNSDIAEIKRQTERRSDTETIGLANKLTIVGNDVDALKTILDNISTQITGFRNSTEAQQASDLAVLQKHFKTLGKWLNENVGGM